MPCRMSGFYDPVMLMRIDKYTKHSVFFSVFFELLAQKSSNWSTSGYDTVLLANADDVMVVIVVTDCCKN